MGGAVASAAASKIPITSSLMAEGASLGAPILGAAAAWLWVMDQEQDEQRDRMTAYQWREVQAAEGYSVSNVER